MKKLSVTGLLLLGVNATVANAQTIVLKPLSDATITESTPSLNQGFSATLDLKPEANTSTS